MARLVGDVVEKRDVLRPGNAGHHAKAGSRGIVHYGVSRSGIGANGVDAMASHDGKIRRDLLAGRNLVTLRCRGERPI